MNDERHETTTTADIAGSARSEEEDRDAPLSREAGERDGDTGAGATTEQMVPLFQAEEGQQLRERWTAIQTGFVDDPRQMVEQADSLVADLMQRLAAQFNDERTRLESQWDQSDDVSTEDLRVALMRYRSFFERLLAV